MKSIYFYLLCFFLPISSIAQWSTVGDYNLAPKVLASAGANNDVLFIAGGNTQGFQVNNQFDIFYFDENRWERILLSSGRVVTSSAISDKFGFVSGGTNWSTYVTSDVVDIIDLSTLATSTTTLQEARAYHTSIAHNGKVYFAGGATALNSAGPISVTGLVEVYDIVNETWTSMELSEPRCHLAVAELNNKLYFAGGWNELGVPSDVVDIYDVENDSWTVEKLSIPRIGPGLGSLNGKIYFAGGNNHQNTHYDIIDIYDDDTKEWDAKTLSNRRTAVEVVSACDKIYFVGGGTANLSTGWITGGSNRVDVYDSITDEWSTNDLIDNKYGAAVASIRDRIYVSGGWDPKSFFTGSGIIYMHECERSPTSRQNIKSVDLVLFPNPVSASTSLKITGRQNIEQVKIYNAMGQLLQHSQLENQSILLNASLSPGIYFCSLKSSDGTIYMENLVIE